MNKKKSNQVIEDGSQGGEPERTAICIHLGVRKERGLDGCGAVFHLHSSSVAALSCLADPSLVPIHQHHCLFHGRTAYYSEYGLADAFEEGRSIGRALPGDKDVLVMSNHGSLVAVPNCHRAFDDCYYLEQAAEFQVGD